MRTKSVIWTTTLVVAVGAACYSLYAVLYFPVLAHLSHGMPDRVHEARMLTRYGAVGLAVAVLVAILSGVSLRKLSREPNQIGVDGTGSREERMKARGVLFSIVICAVLIIGVSVFVNMRNARRNAYRSACIGDLRLIEASKDNYAIDYGATNGTQLTWDNLCYYIKDCTNKCFCPSATLSQRSPTNYVLNPIGVNAECVIMKYGHNLTNR